MDTDFISFRKTSDDEEEEELNSSEQEEEQEETEDGSYNIEDILKRTAASLKKQLDRLELRHADHISLGDEKENKTTAGEQQKPQVQKKDLRLTTGFEGVRMYLHEEGDKEKLPAAVTLHTTEKDRRYLAKPRAPKGSRWGFMRAPRLTRARKLEYKVILLRAQLDPKRRYKRMPDEIPKVFQFGRVVSGAGEFYSGRLARKEQKNTLVDELLADRELRQRAKRKYTEIQTQRMSGKGALKKRKMERMPKWKQKVGGGSSGKRRN